MQCGVTALNDGRHRQNYRSENAARGIPVLLGTRAALHDCSSQDFSGMDLK
jgi:hypothetical protein